MSGLISYLALKLGLHSLSLSLSSRQIVDDASLSFKILNDHVNCPEILEDIGWLVPLLSLGPWVPFMRHFTQKRIVSMDLSSGIHAQILNNVCIKNWMCS